MHDPVTVNPATFSPLIAGLFDRDVFASELRGPGSPALLYPSEAAYSAGFALKRSAEFAAGRLCARRGLAQLGIRDYAIETNADRTPRWPGGCAGSITHTRDFCAAVVARTPPIVAIGIDAETIGRITPEIHALIFTSEEAAAVRSLIGDEHARAQALIFSAKEAFYKCQYPITSAWRNFHDVCVDFASLGNTGEFTVHASTTAQITDWGLKMPLRGRFAIEEDLIVTGIVVR